MRSKQRKTVRMLIVILAALLGLGCLLLAGMAWKSRSGFAGLASATVPDNIIYGGETTTQSMDPSGEHTEAAAPEEDPLSTEQPEQKEISIALHKFRHSDNTPFKAVNMFPGDSVQNCYGIAVSYENTVTVHFHADIQSGYQSLGQVLNCRVVLLNTGDVLYDGLMQAMPESVSYILKTEAPVTDKLRYEVTAYLDTGVGNAYQNKSLAADLRWWVEEDANLLPPQTGDRTSVVLLAVLAGISLMSVILLLQTRRKEDRADGR